MRAVGMHRMGPDMAIGASTTPSHGVSMNELPIPTQAGQVQTKNARSQMLDTLTRQNQKAAVVGNQCQALPLQRGRPA
jgi:hypothetical protein